MSHRDIALVIAVALLVTVTVMTVIGLRGPGFRGRVPARVDRLAANSGLGQGQLQ
ncbi:hypothetical protein [Nocardia sp. CA-120079]|uniref:hypothetical protein n=1 Tax=Nocardia sp. CA-120079 TaxID=3239974 RepID=UPI003D9742AA